MYAKQQAKIDQRQPLTREGWAEAHGVMFVNRSAGLYTTGTVSAAALEEIFAEADALRRERDDLAARLETIVHILTRARLEK